ncbi:MAG: phospholipase D-like domain-containing protein, partial [Candidatus Hodarchaeota archaeon]
ELFHSKFVIIDTKIAWITSCNLLSYWYTDESPQEIFCELEGGKVLRELIEHIRSKLTRKQEELKWIDSLTEKGISESSIITRQKQTLNHFKDIIGELKEKCAAITENPTDTSLTNILRSTFDEMNKTLRALREFETGILIKDLEHRKILRAGLQSSRNSVRIATDRILRPALGPVIITALNNALSRGIPVQVRWGRDHQSKVSENTLSEFKSNIEFLHAETKNKIEISDFPSHSHAKFLTIDTHFLVVTSYNLFAFAGNGLIDDEITEELGIVLTSPREIENITKTFPVPKKLEKPPKKSSKKKRRPRRKREEKTIVDFKRKNK